MFGSSPSSLSESSASGAPNSQQAASAALESGRERSSSRVLWGGDQGEFVGSMPSSFSEALSRSVEVSFMLKGRSPWLSSSVTSGGGGGGMHEEAMGHSLDEQRARSISFASVDHAPHSVESMSSVSVRSRAAQHPHTSGVVSMRSVSSRGGGEDAEGAGEPLLRHQREERYIDPITGEDLSHIADASSARSLTGLGSLKGAAPPPELSGLLQSVFNATNLLMGCGLLSLPYALRLCGWIPGVGMLLFFSAVTMHTAKLLGKIMDYTPHQKLRDGPGAYTMFGFHDMGLVTFGRPGQALVSFLFIGETFGYACIYLIIEAENLKQQLSRYKTFQGWETQHFMCLSALIFLPTMWLRNLSVLSYFSAAGIVASIGLLVGVMIDGFVGEPNPDTCKLPHCTGRVLNPSQTELYHLGEIGVVLGILLVGYAGHAVLPTIRNDMKDKREYGRMVDWTYLIVVTAYTAMAVFGYLMFGTSTSQQITLNLGPNLVSQATVWVVVANPITKFALDMAPIALGIESFVQVAFKIPATGTLSLAVSVLLRTLLTAVALAVVVAVSDFALMMGILGSVCSFTISISLPCASYVILFWGELSPFSKAINAFIAVLGIICAFIGTVSALSHAAPGASLGDYLVNVIAE